MEPPADWYWGGGDSLVVEWRPLPPPWPRATCCAVRNEWLGRLWSSLTHDGFRDNEYLSVIGISKLFVT